MAKVQGPLFSLRGSGTLGRTITFQGRAGSTCVFRRTVPYDVKSVSQRAIREYIRAGIWYWHNMGAPYRALWNAFVN
jgi:hypothetical protein